MRLLKFCYENLTKKSIIVYNIEKHAAVVEVNILSVRFDSMR